MIQAATPLSAPRLPDVRSVMEFSGALTMEMLQGRGARVSGSLAPMQSLPWMRAAVNAFSSDQSVTSLVAGGRDEAAAFITLVRRTNPDRFEPVGVSELYEAMTWLSVDPPVIRLLAGACSNLKAPIIIPRIREDSPFVSAITEAFERRGLVLTRPVEGSPWVALDDSWLEPEQHLSASNRRTILRRRRRATELGELTYEVNTPTPENVDAMLAQALCVEAASWKGVSGSALLHDAARGQFFWEYARQIAHEGTLKICFLRIGEEYAAMNIGVEHGRTFWALKMGYDERFARLSPGRLLAIEALRDAASRGLEQFEMLGALDPYKIEFHPQVHPCVMVRAYPGTLRSAMTLASDLAGWGWKRISHGIRQGEPANETPAS